MRKIQFWGILLILVLAVVSVPTAARYIEALPTKTATITAYQVEQSQITIEHIDAQTGETLVASEVIEVEVGTTVVSRDYRQAIANYEFAHAEPELLEVSDSAHTIRLFYQAEPTITQYDVTIEHLSETGVTLQEPTVLTAVAEGTQLVGSDYQQALVGYEFIASQPEVLTVGPNAQTVTLTYREVIAPTSETVAIHYLDEQTQLALEPTQFLSDVPHGTVIDAQAYSKVIDGYELIRMEPEHLTVSAEAKTIRMYYRAVSVPTQKYDVSIHYLDAQTQATLSAPVVLAQVTAGSIITGSDYVKTLPGYEVEAITPTQLLVEAGQTTITISYRQVKPETVTVQVYHYDQVTGELLGETSIDHVESGSYLLGKDYQQPFTGYEFSSAEPEVLQITPANHRFNLYYQQVTPPPVLPDDEGNTDSEQQVPTVPETETQPETQPEIQPNLGTPMPTPENDDSAVFVPNAEEPQVQLDPHSQPTTDGNGLNTSGTQFTGLDDTVRYTPYLKLVIAGAIPIIAHTYRKRKTAQQLQASATEVDGEA